MDSNLTASPFSVFLSFSLVLIALFISYREKLGLGKDIIIAVVRMIIQLILVAFLLEYIFDVDNVILTTAMIVVIVTNAAVNAAGRGHGLKRPFISSFIALAVTTTVALGIFVLSGSLQYVPSQVIPVSGMIIGSAMSSVGLAYSNLFQLFKDHEQSVQERLALGATPYEASKVVLKLTIKNGLQPQIDSVRTTGIVTLPGMMSGLILAGVDPMHAITYQIMIMFMMIGATTFSTFIATYLSYKSFFNDRYQLNVDLRS